MKVEPRPSADRWARISAWMGLAWAFLGACCAAPAWGQADNPLQPEAATGLNRQNSVAFARQGVSAAHPLASQAGLDILRQGGSALDAAIAVQMALTLVEPQRVLPGCRGLTYRYWDWNRRYDSSGRPDPAGKARALHVDEALAVTRWDAPRGDALLAASRLRAGRPDLAGAAGFTALCGRDAGLLSEHLQVARVHGTGDLDLPDWNALRALTVVDGSVTIDGVTVSRGQSAAVPASCGRRGASLRGAHAIISAVY